MSIEKRLLCKCKLPHSLVKRDMVHRISRGGLCSVGFLVSVLSGIFKLLKIHLL